MTLLSVENLSVRFRVPRGEVAALSSVDLELQSGELLVVAGESGSGKSVLASALLGLLPENAGIEGRIRLGKDELSELPERRMRAVRARRVALIPQSPATALNPYRRLGPQLIESARARGLPRRAAPGRIAELLEEFGLVPDEVFGSYAHRLSGGMQQRVVNALALAGEPELVIADEPTSGLDAELVDATAGSLARVTGHGAALIVITHDLRLARSLGETLGGRLALMYAGRIVEERPLKAFFENPAHPYGRGLLRALPENGATTIPGLPPELDDLPTGCAFADRCPAVHDRCREAEPQNQPLPGGGRVRCLLHA